MKQLYLPNKVHTIFILLLFPVLMFAQSSAISKEKHLIFHDIDVDSSGKIMPWYNTDPAISYDHILNQLWNYWKYVPGHWPRKAAHSDAYPEWRKELPFPPKYLVFRTFEDIGIGGDQFAMMLSSFNLYYDYTGNQEVLNSMIFQANWYLDHSLSKKSDAWPGIPYPCNLTEAPVYEGDLILGKNITQPDKAGSFGAELIMLYKKTGLEKYLTAAVNIANTLVSNTKEGDYDHSPIPFKVDAVTGEIKSQYTTNWVGTLRLLDGLKALGKDQDGQYNKAYTMISKWLVEFPVKNNRWGPFFEDISVWSDTEINEGQLAFYILNNTDKFPDWKIQVRQMQDWAISKLGIDQWKQYGCVVMGEQTVYKMQGQSHTSRHAAVELLYALMTGDNSHRDEAIRQLNFASYAVDDDGKCRWMNFATYEIWWTDGYGDFMRHYLRAMASLPVLAPAENHILSSTSVLNDVKYSNSKMPAPLTNNNNKRSASKTVISYASFDKIGEETIRMNARPSAVLIDNARSSASLNNKIEGYGWTPMAKGGLLKIYRLKGSHVTILD